MKPLKAAALAARSDEPWLKLLQGDAGVCNGVQITSFIDDTGTGAVSETMQRHADAPFGATLVLASTETCAWARTQIQRVLDRSTPIIVIARRLKPSMLRQLLANGADDFIGAAQARDELALRLWRMHANEAPPRPESRCLARHPGLAALIGRNPAFLHQLDCVPAFAACNSGVLILGETGTGKELFAQALHYLSPRSARPLVAVNCGALPAELVESELFGHVRGAFTNAHEAKKGLVAQAGGGSLFLDEVDSLPPATQVKLLRFLQAKEYRAVGAVRSERADVRVIAACNADLGSRVDRGTFRADLYYRLNVLTLHLPALRERPEDLLPLAEHFLAHYAHEFERPLKSLAPAAREAIAEHVWPGNVRELQHAIERGVLLAQGAEIGREDLDLPHAAATSAATPAGSFQAAKARMVAQFERAYIENLLARHGGNITHAADAAAKNRRAFFQLMKKHRIGPERFRGPA